MHMVQDAPGLAHAARCDEPCAAPGTGLVVYTAEAGGGSKASAAQAHQQRRRIHTRGVASFQLLHRIAAPPAQRSL
jgi:hypothetical protein